MWLAPQNGNDDDLDEYQKWIRSQNQQNNAGPQYQEAQPRTDSGGDSPFQERSWIHPTAPAGVQPNGGMSYAGHQPGSSFYENGGPSNGGTKTAPKYKSAKDAFSGLIGQYQGDDLINQMHQAGFGNELGKYYGDKNQYGFETFYAAPGTGDNPWDLIDRTPHGPKSMSMSPLMMAIQQFSGGGVPGGDGGQQDLYTNPYAQMSQTPSIPQDVLRQLLLQAISGGQQSQFQY